MARPEKFEDLAEYQRQDVQIVDISIREIVEHASPLFASAALNLISIAETEGYIVSRVGEWKISRRKNLGEQADLLKSEQSSWDYDKRKYDAAMDGEALNSYSERLAIKFAEREGLPIPPNLVEAEVPNA